MCVQDCKKLTLKNVIFFASCATFSDTNLWVICIASQLIFINNRVFLKPLIIFEKLLFSYFSPDPTDLLNLLIKK